MLCQKTLQPSQINQMAKPVRTGRWPFSRMVYISGLEEFREWRAEWKAHRIASAVARRTLFLVKTQNEQAYVRLRLRRDGRIMPVNWEPLIHGLVMAGCGSQLKRIISTGSGGLKRGMHEFRQNAAAVIARSLIENREPQAALETIAAESLGALERAFGSR